MNNLYNDLIQPQNYLAEEILLGYIINNPNSFNYILQNINIEYFFLESHKIIYRHLNKIYYKSKINIFNLISSLEDQDNLSEIGNLIKLIEISKQGQLFNLSINKQFYITELLNIIYESYTKRLIIQYAYNIITLSYNDKVSSQQIHAKASQYLNYINTKVNNKNLGNLQISIGNLITNLQNKNTRSKRLSKEILSGFTNLDILTNGLPSGDLIIIAGRPSMGKTSLAINIAYHILQDQYNKLCIFSLEMTKIQILHKLISIGSTIPIKHILTGKININQWLKIQYICKQLIESEIYINDTANIAIEDINYILDLIIINNKRKIIVIIDYLQLIQARYLKSDNRVQELSYITRQLKILAQNLNIPIIVLSQLNRRIEARINKKPLLSDLKESGCLQYDLFLNINKVNSIEIQNILYYSQNVSTYLLYTWQSNEIKYILKSNDNHMDMIKIFIEQIFYYTIHYKKIILITDNHPLLNINFWSKQSELKEYNCIIRSKIYYREINILAKNTNISLSLFNHNLVYDIEKNKFSNFFYNSFLVHNSIEQDADVVIMLYSADLEEERQNLFNEKIIDISISKNRNGSVGNFQLLFNLPNSIFKDTKSK